MTDREALKYAGRMGHEVAIVLDDTASNIPGARYVVAELSSVERARAMVRNDYPNRGAQIWARNARGAWAKKWTPAA